MAESVAAAPSGVDPLVFWLAQHIVFFPLVTALRLLATVSAYLVLGALFLTVVAAGFALSIDLSQFRYTAF